MKGKQNAYSLQQNKKFVLDKGYSLKSKIMEQVKIMLKIKKEQYLTIEKYLQIMKKSKKI